MNPAPMTKRAQDGKTVCAVIVSYQPDLARLEALVESVVAQADGVLIVDNGSASQAVARMREWEGRYGARLIELGENRGIGAAHNVGIRRALADGFANVMLLDHDSRLGPHCIERMVAMQQRLLQSGVRLAAVGPRYHDETTGLYAPFLRFSRWGVHKKAALPEEEAIETSILISSGTLIRGEEIAAIGMMDEDLFIEGVDWEWCFRAAALGYRLFGVAGAVMLHSLGDSGMRVLWRTLPLHGPLRHYYAYRNTVLMCRMPRIPPSWKLYFSSRLALRFLLYMILAPQRMRRFNLIRRGLCDGIHGRGGRLSMPYAN